MGCFFLISLVGFEFNLSSFLLPQHFPIPEIFTGVGPGSDGRFYLGVPI